jgi:hypothetical protein
LEGGYPAPGIINAELRRVACGWSLPPISDRRRYMKTKVLFVAVLFFLAGCPGLQKTPHAPNDENIRYMYITVYPDECTLTLTVEFKDATPTFRDERITHEHEPINYSVDRRKVKRIHIIAKKSGWVTQEKEYLGEVPYDVFVKLNTVQ